MTMATPVWEARDWSAFGVTPTPVTRLTQIQRPGLAEIKPHTPTGIRKGLKQLRDRVKSHPGREMWLVTYKGTDASGLANPPTGMADGLQVFARCFNVTTRDLDGPWYKLGFLRLNRIMQHPPVDHPGMFGMAVERRVYDLFTSQLPLNRRAQAGTGGSLPGPDVLWSELAALYAELARELRDPFYAELASELADLAHRRRPVRYGAARVAGAAPDR
jgi:hypothetical protein